MITQRDKQLLILVLQEIIHDEVLPLLKDSKQFNQDVGKKLDSLHAKIGEFIKILERYERKQKILEKKLEAIEDYFDPSPSN